MSLIANQPDRSRRGMTLIEMIVAMAIFSAVMSGVILMFTSVTNTVRRSYRTMDTFEAVRGALMAVERDVQTTFSAPAAGSDLHFFGEQHGFVFVGIAPNGRIGRLTYALHLDTSRLSSPGTGEWRGEQLTLMRNWDELARRFPGSPNEQDAALNAFYPKPPSIAPEDYYTDVSVEVVYGLLLRYYEETIDNIEEFKKTGDSIGIDRLYPALFGMPESLEKSAYFPWFTRTLLLSPQLGSVVNVPWHIRNKLENVERCHYWLQLLHGPGLPVDVPRSGGREWWRDYYEGWAYGYGNARREAWRSPLDLWRWQWMNEEWFWIDPNVKNHDVSVPEANLWDHVVAEDFVLATFLLDPITGARIMVQEGRTVLGENLFYDRYVPVLAPEPIFQYQTEMGVLTTQFNTLYNLNHRIEDPIGRIYWALEEIIDKMANNPANPDISLEIQAMTETRLFEDLGSPTQSRLPSAFTITFWVLNESVVGNAPPDLYRFAQTVHIPSGFMRPSNAQ